MHLVSLSLLLAEGTAARAAARAGGGWSLLSFTSLGAITAGLAIGVLIVWCLSRKKSPQGEQPRHSPQRLLSELSQAHRLSAAQQRLLEWVVNLQPGMQPAMVFLDPILLERAIARSDSPGVRKRLNELRTKLFAGAALAAEQLRR